ncbi:MAG TPA: hypothetical protein VL995_00820 [Cellvibrio sp.]|nr:hypothetical protein [Cellvibrio sp.]
MKSFSVRPSKFVSVLMILSGAILFYLISVFPKPPEDFGAPIITFMRIGVIGMMLFGLANLVLPRGVATEKIEATTLVNHKSPATESFAALQHLYEKGLLTHEEYRNKVDLLTREDKSNSLKR